MTYELKRRDFLGATAATAGASAWPAIGNARSRRHTLKVGTNVPESHPLNIYLHKAADDIKKETDGQVNLEIFANNELGGDPAMFLQLRTGALQIFLLSGVNVLSSLIPDTAVSGVGFAWKDSDTVFKALDGDLGDKLRAQIRGKGIEVMHKIWNNGFREITSSTRPIRKVGDLRGFKIRVPVSDLWTSLFKSLGASPTDISFAEVYTSLQTKVVDGQENPPAIIYAAKLYEVQKYLSLTNHMWDGWWCLVASSAWKSLPDKFQEIVARNLNQRADEQRAVIIEQNNTLKATLVKKGMQMNTVDPAPFKEKLRDAGFYTHWKKKFGPELWATMEKYTGPLA